MGYFNNDFAGGKWNHFMDQSHLGYTGWADPPDNSLRAINLKRGSTRTITVGCDSRRIRGRYGPEMRGFPLCPVLIFSTDRSFLSIYSIREKDLLSLQQLLKTPG